MDYHLARTKPPSYAPVGVGPDGTPNARPRTQSPLVPDTGGKTGAQGVGGPCSAFTHYTPQLQAHMVYARAPYGDLVCSGLYC